MFTGIIEGLGTVTGIAPMSGGVRMSIRSDFALENTDVGDSISVNGACLTAVQVEEKAFQVDVAPETLSRSSLNGVKVGDRVNLERALRLGFAKVSQEKLAVAKAIKSYTGQGGFLFSMYSGTDSYDIALSAEGTDICAVPFDGDGIDPDCQQRLDYSRCLAFEDFTLLTDPMMYEFSDIDVSPRTGMAPCPP